MQKVQLKILIVALFLIILLFYNSCLKFLCISMYLQNSYYIKKTAGLSPTAQFYLSFRCFTT